MKLFLYKNNSTAMMEDSSDDELELDMPAVKNKSKRDNKIDQSDCDSESDSDSDSDDDPFSFQVRTFKRKTRNDNVNKDDEKKDTRTNLPQLQKEGDDEDEDSDKEEFLCRRSAKKGRGGSANVWNRKTKKPLGRYGACNDDDEADDIVLVDGTKSARNNSAMHNFIDIGSSSEEEDDDHDDDTPENRGSAAQHLQGDGDDASPIVSDALLRAREARNALEQAQQTTTISTESHSVDHDTSFGSITAAIDVDDEDDTAQTVPATSQPASPNANGNSILLNLRTSVAIKTAPKTRNGGVRTRRAAASAAASTTSFSPPSAPRSYKVNMDLPLQRLMDDFRKTNQSTIPPNSSVEFRFDGDVMQLDKLPSTYDVEDGDLIDVIIEPGAHPTPPVVPLAPTTTKNRETPLPPPCKPQTTSSSRIGIDPSASRIVLQTRLVRPSSSASSWTRNAPMRKWQIRRTDRLHKLVDAYRKEQLLPPGSVVLKRPRALKDGDEEQAVEAQRRKEASERAAAAAAATANTIVIDLDDDEEEDEENQEKQDEDSLEELDLGSTPLLLGLVDNEVLDMVVLQNPTAPVDVLILDDETDSPSRQTHATQLGSAPSPPGRAKIMLKLRVNGNDKATHVHHVGPLEPFQSLLEDFCRKRGMQGGTQEVKLMLDGDALNLAGNCQNEDLEGGEIIDVIIK